MRGMLTLDTRNTHSIDNVRGESERNFLCDFECSTLRFETVSARSGSEIEKVKLTLSKRQLKST